MIDCFKYTLVEDDLNLKEPINFKRYLIGMWLLFGVTVFYKDASAYIAKLREPVEGIDYT